MLETFNIFQIIPQIVSSIHNKMIMEYFKSGKSTILNKEQILYGITSKKKLFSFFGFIKLFLDRTFFTNISYIKKRDEKSFLIVNQKGEIDCFGEKFFEMTNINYEIPFFHSHISIFLFLPQLIPFFISYFTNIKELQIEVK